MIKHSSAAEVARLLESLLSEEPVAREAAAARLAILGARVVDRVTATLEGLQDPSHVVAVLDVLERIGDPRGAAAAEALLADSRETVSAAAVAVVRRALQAEGAEIAARAMDALVQVASDLARSEALRGLAQEALGDLPEDVLQSLRQRWPGVLAARVQAAPRETSPLPDATALASWTEGGSGLDAAEIQQAIAGNAADLPLPVLHRAIERLRDVETRSAPKEAADWQAARSLAHQALAARGSRVALYDLRETVERHPERLTVGMLAALGSLGDSSCLEPLAAAWARTTDAWLKTQLRDVFLGIAAREGVTRRHTLMKRLGAHHPALIEALSTPSRTKPSRRRLPRT